MSKLLKIIIAVAVLAVAGLAAVYFLLFASDSPEKFKPTPAAEDAKPLSGVIGAWSIAAGSEAGYRVREKLANLPAQSDAVGRTSGVTGLVVLGKTAVTKASFEVDVTTLESDEDRRDNRVRDALQTTEFPTATFVLTDPKIVIDSTKSKADVQATGDLTIHGVTKSVTIPITATVVDGQIELVGSITFPMADYGITPPSIGGFVTVEDDATLEFKIILERKDGAA